VHLVGLIIQRNICVSFKNNMHGDVC
jgi:hypothetical protein